MKKTGLHHIETIRTILKDKMYIDYPSDDTDLLKNGYLDSLSFVNMLSLLEEEFDIRVETEDIEYDYFRTPADIDAFVEKKMAAKSNIPQ